MTAKENGESSAERRGGRVQRTFEKKADTRPKAERPKQNSVANRASHQ